MNKAGRIDIVILTYSQVQIISIQPYNQSAKLLKHYFGATTKNIEIQLRHFTQLQAISTSLKFFKI